MVRLGRPTDLPTDLIKGAICMMAAPTEFRKKAGQVPVPIADALMYFPYQWRILIRWRLTMQKTSTPPVFVAFEISSSQEVLFLRAALSRLIP